MFEFLQLPHNAPFGSLEFFPKSDSFVDAVRLWSPILGCFGFWIVAYILIIKRSFQDKMPGVPAVAACGNIGWEIMVTFIYLNDYKLTRIGHPPWVLLDVVIIYAIYKYGRDDHKEDFYKKWLRPGLFLGILISVVIQTEFARAFHDVHGIILGWVVALVDALMFIAMLVRRNNLLGQSFYIAVFMFLGNASALWWNMTFPEIHTFDKRLCAVLCTIILSFQAIYAVMVYKKCWEEGINPWKRW